MKFARVAVPAPLLPLDRLLDYVIPDELAETIFPGSLVQIPFGKRKCFGMVFEVTQNTSVDPAKLKSVLSAKFPQAIFDGARLEFLAWLSKHYFFPIGEVCESAVPTSIREGSEKTLKLPADRKLKEAVIAEAPPLNDDQAKAIEKILQRSEGAELLWGVTGSGKTEVYLQVIQEKIKQGLGALVLVPEISLTPQLTQRFESRFPSQVAVFHSALKPTQTRRAWLETLNGQTPIAIGARSALFAPVKNLGIIIIDEEHDSSYKQEERLRYHARDAALALARFSKIPVLLGSATPSAETLYEVQGERYGVSLLPKRAVGEAQLPSIEIVDLKKQLAVQNKNPALGKGLVEENSEGQFEAPTSSGDFFLSPELRAALEKTLAKKQQSILFLNRRGLGSQEFCRNCGFVNECPNCDVKLTPHHRGLLCHYCGFTEASPAECEQCHAGSHPFVHVGVGTEAIEESLHLHFPKARVLRLDRDTAAAVGSMDLIVESFRNGEADVLIGTQMVAKGHDFPDVTLVGILLADLGLSVPDFRAFERNLQLLLQVSGRAGRGFHPGRVLVQAFQTDHPVFLALQNQRSLEDYGAFIKEEIEKRKLLKYPPLGRLCLFRFDGLDSAQVQDAARTVGQALRRLNQEKAQVLGPVVCPIAKLRARHRWQILMKAPNSQVVQQSVNWILQGWETQKLEKKFRTRLIVDVDPVQML